MSNHEHEGQMSQIETEWEKLEGERRKFNREEVLEHVGKESFLQKKECVCCIDERVAARATLGGEEAGGRWFVAGSGILLPVENWQERAKAAAEEAHRRGVKRFSYHAGCGAAGLAVKADAKQLVDIERYQKNPGLHAEQFSNLAQKELNRLTGLDEEVIFVPKDEVVPTGFHNALGAVVDATGEFNSHTLPDGEPLKHCFMLDWKSGDTLPAGSNGTEYNLLELQTAIGIAFGHGFKERFNSSNRFNIVIMADSKDELEAIQESIDSYITSELHQLKDRLRVITYLRTK